jgi:hypothetical protein
MKAKMKPGIIIQEVHRKAFENMTDAKCGELLKILIEYQFDGVLPSDISPDLEVALNFLTPILDQQRVEYEKTCEERRKGANKRWGNEDE